MSTMKTAHEKQEVIMQMHMQSSDAYSSEFFTDTQSKAQPPQPQIINQSIEEAIPVEVEAPAEEDAD